MIYDSENNPRYYDKPWDSRIRPISPELRRLYIEMDENPRFHISRECNFYPKGFPSTSPGWGIGC